MMSRSLPERASLEFLSKQSKDFLRAAKSGDAIAVERLCAWGPAGAFKPPTLADCQHALAREYGFASWPKLKAHVEELAAADPSDALAAALKSHDANAVAGVISHHPELRSKLDEPVAGGAFGATPLIVAVQHANRAMVDVLLDAGADINQRSHWWAGGFHVLEDDHGLADFLIERGAVLDAVAAAKLGRLADLERLVAADPKAVYQRAGDGQTPLHVAASLAIAQFLVEHGAEVDARDVDHESTPAQYLVRSHPEIARFLVSRGAKSDILLASALGEIGRVRTMLDADPGAVGTIVSDEFFPRQNPHAGGSIYIWTLGQKKSPHAVAREFGHEDVFRLLMERTPEPLRLALACETGDQTAFAALLKSQPDMVQRLTSAERRKLPDAAQNNNVAAVRLMLEAGWPIDTPGQHGATALHWAGFHGNPEMARVILAHNPSLEVKEKDYGQTSVGWVIHGSLNGWYSQTGDYAGTLELLLDAGAVGPTTLKQVKGSKAVMALLRKRA
ncbi:MAG: ankyrin repeat domain-containing protein [Gemmatimonadota bacterium]